MIPIPMPGVRLETVISPTFLAQTDTYIGELLNTIEELGIKDDTIFIFTSDNGGYGGVGREGFNGPWRGSLFTSYEGSFRVPFLIRWPGKIPPRQKSNEIVHSDGCIRHISGHAGS